MEKKLQFMTLKKSVCDAIRYRNKVGIDITSEVLRNCCLTGRK